LMPFDPDRRSHGTKRSRQPSAKSSVKKEC
jgi:hypothetical protein